MAASFGIVVPKAETTSLLAGFLLSGLRAQGDCSRRIATGYPHSEGPVQQRVHSAFLISDTSGRSSASGLEVVMAAALARLGLRAVKQVRVQFCPFEKNVESTRY